MGPFCSHGFWVHIYLICWLVLNLSSILVQMNGKWKNVIAFIWFIWQTLNSVLIYRLEKSQEINSRSLVDKSADCLVLIISQPTIGTSLTNIKQQYTIIFYKLISQQSFMNSLNDEWGLSPAFPLLPHLPLSKHLHIHSQPSLGRMSQAETTKEIMLWPRF